MKKKEKNKAVQTIALCGCLCLAALGAGVTYRAFDRGEVQTEEKEQKAAAVQTPKLDTALLEREKQSNDPGEAPTEEIVQKETKPTVQTEKAVFAYPLEGEVLLPYSIDHAIYDPTLEQYHTHAAISLSAEKGTAVQAAADGTVKEVTADEERGTVIVLEHADGWLTTYGQLEDTVKVKKGESVKQGQTIALVDTPTKYGAALGPHLEFAMEQNGTPADPQEKLQKQ